MTEQHDSSGRMVRRMGMKAAVLVAAVMASSAMAATYTWTSTTNGNWSDAAKWDANGVPVTDGTADIVFNAGNLTSTINSAWAVSGSINSLKLQSTVTSGNVALSNGSGVTGLTIGAGGIQSLSTSRTFNSINVGTLTLAASQTWSNVAGTDLRLGSSTNLASAAGVVVTINGSGNIRFDGGGNSTNFLGSFVLAKGGVTFAAGNQGGRLGTNATTIGNVGNTSILIGYNGDGTITTPFNLQNNNYQFSFVLNNSPGAKGTTTISSVLTGNINGSTNGGTGNQLGFTAGYAVARSTGSFRMVADNSGLTTSITAADFAAGKYPIFIRSGYVLLDNPNAFGVNNSISFGIGNNYVAGESSTGGVNFSALQATSGHDVNGAIRYRTSSGFFTTPGIAFLGLEGAGSVNYNGNIFLNTNDDAKVVGTMHLSASAGGTAKFNGVIADAAVDSTGPLKTYKARLAAFGEGTVEVNGNNTYLGTTLVRAGTLVVGHNNALGSAATDVNLGDTTIAPVTVKAATDTKPNTNASTTDMVLTFDSAVNSVDGVAIADGDRILVHNNNYRAARNGIYVRTNATTWTRDTSFDVGSEFAYGQQVYVNGGTVNGGRTYFLANRTDVSPITIGQQALTFTDDILNPETAILLKSGVTLSRNINVVANASAGKSILGSTATSGVSEFTGTVALNKALTVTAASGGEARFSGNITGSFGITKEGSGKVSFDGNKTYTGVTAVTAGVLEVNGALASTQVDIFAGGTLAGSGNLAGVVVSNGGTLSPGNSPGTMTIAGLTLDAASNLNYDLKANDLTIGAGVNDMIQINGNLTLAGTLNVAVYGGSELSFGTYRLMNYTGTLTNNTLQLAGGLSATRTYQIDTNTAGQVNLVVSPIPEPASLGLLTFGSVLIAARPRKLTK